MDILNFKKLFVKFVTISIIFSSFLVNCTNVFAATSIPDTMESEISDWVNNAKREVIEYKYVQGGNEQTTYAVSMPKINTNKYPNIEYDATKASYVYLVRDENDDVCGSIPFDVDILMSTNSSDPLPQNITSSNYQTYLAPGQGSSVLKSEDKLLKIIELDEKSERQMAFVVKLSDGTFIKTDAKTFDFGSSQTITESFFDMVSNGLAWLWDTAMNAITGIFNELLLWIADGIQNLINSIFGSKGSVTIYEVIFGKIDKLAINYWESGNTSNGTGIENIPGIVDNSPAPTLKNIVSYWYGIFRGIAISIYLVMLLYIAVRILLSSTANVGQKYKEMLTSWLVGLVILIFFPYVMRYIVVVNDTFVSMIDQGSTNETLETEEGKIGTTDAMIQIRNLAEEQSNIALTIVYIIMLGQLIVLLGVYYKRAFMVAFLITIFPIVATLYIWEKTNGKSKSLGTWTKEYVIVVFTQVFHAVVYVILIDGALSAFKTSQNWFMFVLSVMFLFEAEKIIRKIFEMESSANTIGNLAAAGAAAWGATRGFKNIFAPNKNSKSKDAEDQEDATNEVEAAKKNTAINRSLQETYFNSQGRSSAATTGGGVTGGGTPTGGVPVTNGEVPEDPLDNLQAAQALIAEETLKRKTKRGIIHGAINLTASGVARASGITLGVTSGLATGSMQTGFANAVMANEVAGVAAKGVHGITGWAKGQFDGKVMKMKVKSGAMNNKLREVGFDIDGKFDENEHISNAKAEIIKEALAAQAEMTRKGGKVKGELAFVKEIEKGRKRENI